MDWYVFLPEALRSRAFVASYGELAWSKQDALAVIDLLFDVGFKILGVDIWGVGEEGPWISPFVYDLDVSDEAFELAARHARTFVKAFNGTRPIRSRIALPSSLLRSTPVAPLPIEPPMTNSTEGLPARAAALDLLHAALSRRAGLDDALARPPFSALPPRERGHARALVMAALRRLGPIDRLLDRKLQRPPPDAVRNILRLGAAELYWMQAPDFAVVSTSVDLAASRKETRPFKGLVNAVLRAMARDGAPTVEPHNLCPDWLYARWQAAWGKDDAERIAALIAQEPSTDLSFKAPPSPELGQALEARALPGGSWRTDMGGMISEWPGFVDGLWWIQDAAAAIPARLLGAKAGETAVDLCAAPGGKTLQLAAAGAAVVAVDRSAPRLKRVSENLARMGLAAETVAADAADWADGRLFDAVLLDAPCTATGTFRRHPDVLWASRPGDVAPLASSQAKLLDSAAGRVKPGGRLVYCVCSLEPEEGEQQVERFLKRHPEFRLEPIAPGEGGAPAQGITAEGCLRLLPFHLEGGGDGFFAARFVKR
jgi:16S rRNA (cytosine967-C5)-methyltransferase